MPLRSRGGSLRRRRRIMRRHTRGRRAFGRSHRIPRARTAVVNTVYEVESMRAGLLVPTNATFGGWITYGGTLPGYYTPDTIVYNAVTYSCDFSPSFLASLTGPTSYQYMRQIYDYVKMYKVKVCLKSSFNPSTNLTQAPAVASLNDLTNFLGNDPVISYIDYDGWSSIPKLGATGSVVCPTNGDMTQALMGRKGARRHRMFSSIYRTFYPKQMNLVAGADTTSANPTTTPNLVQGGKLGWMNAGNLNIWCGNLIIAFPYVGQTGATQANLQPKFNYSIAHKYYMGFKCPLYT